MKPAPVGIDMTSWKPRFMARVGTAVLAAVLAAAASGAAWAQAPVDPKVQEHFQAGNDLYQEGRYKDALAEYDAAYEMSKNWKILFNRGQCLVMLKREPDAVVSFEQYLKDGGDQIPPDRRAQVEADLKKLKARLGSIVVNGAPPGSRIDIDGFFAGRAPLAGPIPAGSGYHDVTVTPPGGKGAVGTVKVSAGEKVFFEVQVVTEGGGAAAAPAPASTPAAPDAPPPPPELPPRAPGGLVAPAFELSAALGVAIPTPDYRYGKRQGLGSFELGASWRASGFWEIGLFGGVATGRYGVENGALRTDAAPDLSSSRVNIDTNADYSSRIIGVRARMHLVRTRRVDGWFGVDLGAWSEVWRFTGPQAFEYRADSVAFGLGFGFDVPLSRNWAAGFAARFLAASASNGRRESCDARSIQCNSAYLPGEGAGDGVPQSTSRGFFDLGLRLVYSIPLGGPEPKPAAPAPAPAPVRESAGAGSLLSTPRIW
ncbi:MAG: PEGA domain-containing protein [Deltaproteobacteria bacterium]|nr:PEGA domain-containing protein [Deltaproteobacteria bacterium]